MQKPTGLPNAAGNVATRCSPCLGVSPRPYRYRCERNTRDNTRRLRRMGDGERETRSRKQTMHTQEQKQKLSRKRYSCVFFALKRSFSPSLSSTPGVRVDCSPYTIISITTPVNLSLPFVLLVFYFVLGALYCSTYNIRCDERRE